MQFEVLRKRALSHRFVVALAAIVVLGFTAVSGVDAIASSDTKPYTLEFKALPGDPADSIEFAGRVRENATGLVLARPNVTFKRGAPARITTTSGDRDIAIDLTEYNNFVTAVMRVSQHGVALQETKYSARLEPDGPRNVAGRRYTGAKISLDLKDADLKNVLKMFGNLTGMEVRYPDTLQGKVTLKVHDMPWDEAFDLILRENRLTFKAEGNVVNIIPE